MTQRVTRMQRNERRSSIRASPATPGEAQRGSQVSSASIRSFAAAFARPVVEPWSASPNNDSADNSRRTSSPTELARASVRSRKRAVRVWGADLTFDELRKPGCQMSLVEEKSFGQVHSGLFEWIYVLIRTAGKFHRQSFSNICNITVFSSFDEMNNWWGEDGMN